MLISADKKALEEQQLSEGMKKCPYCAEMIKEEAWNDPYNLDTF